MRKGIVISSVPWMLAMGIAVGSCAGVDVENSDRKEDGGGPVDTDLDSGGGGDADTDSDGDTDTDTDGDTDADTDVDSDTDADSDTDSDTDTDGDSDSDTDGDSDTGTGTGPDTGCTDTAGCDPGQWCDEGSCAACDDDAHCGGGCTDCAADGNLCSADGTTCVECRSDDHCGVREWCNAGGCAPCNVKEHCGVSCLDCTTSGQICDSSGSYCLGCEIDADCATDQWCDSQTCVDCRTPDRCGEGCGPCGLAAPFCREVSGEYACAECLDTLHCGAGEWCDDGDCLTCDEDDHCGTDCLDCTFSGQVCSDDGATCVRCGGDGDCKAANFCNMAGPEPVCEPCEVDAHCGQFCLTCTGTEPHCREGVAGWACAACAVDNQCDGGVAEWCTDAGVCDSCDVNAHCGSSCEDCGDEVCSTDGDECVSCASDVDCVAGKWCNMDGPDPFCETCYWDDHCGPTCLDCGGVAPHCWFNPSSLGYQCAECASRNQCNGGVGQWCEDGSCASCNTNDHCGPNCLNCTQDNGKTCDMSLGGGTCVSCQNDLECDLGSGGRRCDRDLADPACVECVEDAHCGVGCVDCAPGHCFNGGDGASSLCGECANDGHCGAGRWCDTGSCRDCVTPDHCGTACDTCGQVPFAGEPFCDDVGAGAECVECVDRSDCSGGIGEWCNGDGECESCVTTAHCGANCDECGVGAYLTKPHCSAESGSYRCEQCVDDVHCNAGVGEYCDGSNNCQPCETADHCGAGCVTCSGETPACDDPTGSFECVCTAGTCNQSYEHCVPSTGDCEPCVSDTACGPTCATCGAQHCWAHDGISECVDCTDAAHCASSPAGTECRLTDHLCVECLTADDADATCLARFGAARQYCTGNTCVGCISDGHCADDEYCRAGDSTCQPCVANDQCGVGCVDCTLVGSTPVCTDLGGGHGCHCTTAPGDSCNNGSNYLRCDGASGACGVCTDDTACGPGCGDCAPYHCWDHDSISECVECTTELHCAGVSGRPHCLTADHTCVGCRDSVDCGADVCDTATHTCEECTVTDAYDAACNTKYLGNRDYCTSKSCVECLDDGQCTGDLVCDPLAHICVECLDGSDCETDEFCRGADDTCQPCEADGQCGVGCVVCGIGANTGKDYCDDPDGDTVYACVECEVRSQCAGGVGEWCNGSGACEACTSDDHCGDNCVDCEGATPFCRWDGLDYACAECLAHSDCEGGVGQRCVDGGCVDCVTDGRCGDSCTDCEGADPERPHCRDTGGGVYECAECATTPQCSGGIGELCLGGVCEDCVVDSMCGDSCVDCSGVSGKPYCSNASGDFVCEECVGDIQCSAGVGEYCDTSLVHPACAPCTIPERCGDACGSCSGKTPACDDPVAPGTYQCACTASSCVDNYEHCQAATGSCEFCDSDTACGPSCGDCGAQHCWSHDSVSECVDCTADVHCGALTPRCAADHTCVECLVADGFDTTCQSLHGGLANYCTGNACVECIDDTPCAGHEYCAADNTCQLCQANNQCGVDCIDCTAIVSTPVCGDIGSGYECLCTSSPDSCNTGANHQHCDGATGDCELCGDDDSCGPGCLDCAGDHCWVHDSVSECEECVGDGHCGGGTPWCLETDHTCVACRDDGDCFGDVCDLGTHTCQECTEVDAYDGACNTRYGGARDYCTANTCVECLTSGDCSGAEDVCETGTHTCVECVGDGDCASDEYCAANNSCQPCVSGSQCGDGCVLCDDGATAGQPYCVDTGAEFECVECEVRSQCAGGVGQYCDAFSCAPCVGDDNCGDNCVDCLGGTPYCFWDGSEYGCAECTGHSHCSLGVGQRCEDGSCVDCVSDAMCGDSCADCRATEEVCKDDGSACVDCNQSTDCSGGVGEWCNTNSCETCDTPGHCGLGCVACDGSYPLCKTDGSGCVQCNVNDDCSGGVGEWCNGSSICEDCITDGHCGPTCADCAGVGEVCKADGTGCVGCNVNADCAGGVNQWCNGSSCEVCDTSGHCGAACDNCLATGDVCKGDGSACVECNGDGDCGGQRCDTSANACVDCLGDGDCLSTEYCRLADHTCQLCAADDECGDGCVDCTGQTTTPVCGNPGASYGCVCTAAPDSCNAGDHQICNPTSGACELCGDDSACGPSCLSCAGDHCWVHDSVSECVDCLDNTHCGGGTAYCYTADHECVACLNSAHCGGDVCDAMTHTCQECTTDDVYDPVCDTKYSGAKDYCTSSSCVECLDSSHCSGGLDVCELGAHVCVECVGGGDCASDEYCAANNTCQLCASAAQCGDGCVECGVGGEAGRPLCVNTGSVFECVECDDHSQCSSGVGERCNAYVCEPCITDGECGDSCVACVDPTPYCRDEGASFNCAECTADVHCSGGVGERCASGVCVDCDTNGSCGDSCTDCTAMPGTPVCNVAGTACVCSGSSCGDYHECITEACEFCAEDAACEASCTACGAATPRCRDNGNSTSTCVECLTADAYDDTCNSLHGGALDYCTSNGCVECIVDGDCPVGTCSGNVCTGGEDGLTCDTAWTISGDGTFAGDTGPNAPTLDPGSACPTRPGGSSLGRAYGPEEIWRVYLNAGERLTAVMHPLTHGDPTLYVITDCANPSGTCIQGSDSVSASTDEKVQFIATVADDYYIVADGYDASDKGTYSLTVTIDTDNLGDTCDDPKLVAGTGPYPETYQGDNTCEGFNDDYDNENAGGTPVCPNSAGAPGRDQVWEVDLQPWERIHAKMTPSGFDSAFYMASDCDDIENTCVAGRDSSGAETFYYISETGGTYYMFADSYSSSGCGTYSLEVTLEAGPWGDKCSDAKTIAAEGPYPEHYVGDNTCNGFTDQYDNENAGGSAVCPNSAGAPGPEQVWQVTLDPLERITAVMDPNGYDSALYMASDCDDIENTCVAGSDTSGNETIQHTSIAGGTYYLYADSYSGGCNTYTLDVTVEQGPFGDTCEDAFEITGAGGLFSDSTTDMINDYSFSSGTCISVSSSSGKDQVWKVDLTTGQDLSVIVDPGIGFDAAIYLVKGDCSPITSTKCVDGSDLVGAGSIETLYHTATEDDTFYIVIDGYNGSSGSYDLDVSIS